MATSEVLPLEIEASDVEQARHELQGQEASPQAIATSAMDVARGLPLEPDPNAGEPQESYHQADQGVQA